MKRKTSELLLRNNPLFILRFKYKGITQVELSKQSKIALTTIANIENGTSNKIFPKTLVKIQEFFNINAIEFYNEYLLWKSSLSKNQPTNTNSN